MLAPAPTTGGSSRRANLPVPCISVGNLSVGGTGKTPMVAWLIDELTALGARPAVVSRGYGGSARGPERVTTGGGYEAAQRIGDEPALLAARYPDVPVVVGSDRHAAGLLAVSSGGATVVVADDAFQHRRLARDVEIVMVDASRGLGNGYQLPAGPLWPGRGGSRAISAGADASRRIKPDSRMTRVRLESLIVVHQSMKSGTRHHTSFV